MVLLGPSGCGKTTALRLIAGLETPTEGKVCLGDLDATYVPPKDRKVAMVFQSYALYPHMSVFDNIAFPLKMKKLPKNEIRSRVIQVVNLLQIKDLLDRKPKELSGGQRQRVALGRAIIKEPEVFLMDEPLSNVDAKLRIYLRGEIRSLQKKLGITTIYVTHDQTEAMAIADRVAIMDGGRLHQVASPLKVYSSPATSFVAGFMGNPPMNLVECSLVEKNGGLSLDAKEFTIDISESANAKKLVREIRSSELLLGVRPENIKFLKRRKKGIPAEIHVIEPLGIGAVGILRIGSIFLRAIIPSGLQLKVGEKVNLLFKPELHVFDKETGQRYLALK